MSHDNGYISKLEAAIVAVLDELTWNDLKMFRNCDHWQYQIAASKGGIQAFENLAPFCFVAYEPFANSTREGDSDLNDKLGFVIAIGQKGPDARIGSEIKPGSLTLRAAVIATLDQWHPGAGFTCDELEYFDDYINVDAEHGYGMIIRFTANQL